MAGDFVEHVGFRPPFVTLENIATVSAVVQQHLRKSVRRTAEETGLKCSSDHAICKVAYTFTLQNS